MLEQSPVSFERLHRFFRPRSIALVGATDNSRWSVSTFQNLKNFGFAGPIFCINPNRSVIHGQSAYKALSDVGEPIDLAYVMVPTQSVYGIVEEAAAAGIRNLVILTSGFSEMGEQGRQLEQRILTLAQEHQMTLLGPNGNGFVNVADQLTPYGLPIVPPLLKGPVGVVLQSGALASTVMTLAQVRCIGLSMLVSMGNETMLSATDMMDYLVEDENTRVIAVFLESIRHPEHFERVARRALARKKPIVALKIGRSDLSARTAMAHTGALVGNDAINDAVLRQLGIIRVDSLEDLLITAGLLGYSAPLKGRRAAIVTPSGGACDILSDLAHKHHIALPEFAPTTAQKLQQIVPAFSTVHNPLDVTGYIVVDRTIQQRALEAVLEDTHFDFVVCLSDPLRAEPLPAFLTPTLEQYDNLGRIVRSARIPVVMMSNATIDITPFGRTLIERSGLHFVGGMEHGMNALGNALWWYEVSQQAPQNEQTQSTPITTWPIPPLGSWPEYTARTFLQQHGIPVVPGILATNAQEAVHAAEMLGFPVVLKIQSADILHKSDVGGVQLNLHDSNAVHAAFQQMSERIQQRRADAHIDGILVSPQRTGTLELLVSVMRDPMWGQILTLGLGGIWVEVLRDSSVRKLPIQHNDIRAMLHELRGVALLRGARGLPGVNIDKLIDVIYRIAQVAESVQTQLDTLEINPLLMREDTIEVADVLLTWNNNWR